MAQPIEFEEANAVYTSKTEGVADLPCFADETMVVSCWELTEEERKLVAETGRVWLGQMTYGKPLQPQAVWFQTPFAPQEPEAQS